VSQKGARPVWAVSDHDFQPLAAAQKHTSGPASTFPVMVEFRFMQILLPIFFLLFTCWMLWGWTVGESKNIKWLRRWCAPTFVVCAMICSAGAGAVLTKVVTQQRIRRDVTELLETIELRIRTGAAASVATELRTIDHSGDPDADAFDVLDHLAVMEHNLSPKPAEVAAAPDKPVLH
jgi:hypothetical protein